MDTETLNQRLLQAHEKSNWQALVELYTEAGNLMESQNDVDGACFFLTHAYIYAMELDAPQLCNLHARLVSHGRVKDCLIASQVSHG